MLNIATIGIKILCTDCTTSVKAIYVNFLLLCFIRIKFVAVWRYNTQQSWAGPGNEAKQISTYMPGVECIKVCSVVHRQCGHDIATVIR